MAVKKTQAAAKELTPKQQRFIDEYLVDLNGTQAAIRAGYSPKTAREQATRLLANVRVAAELQKRRERLKNKLEISQERVLAELAAIAFANGADFVTIRGGTVHVVDTEHVDQEKLPAIAGIKEGLYGVEIKLHDKVRALELIGKHLNLFDGQSAADDLKENNLFDAIAAAAKEAVDTSEIPELQPPADADSDLVEKG